MNRTYDYSFGGHGPLTASSLRAGDRPSLKDVKQYVPQAWERQVLLLGALEEDSNCVYEPYLPPKRHRTIRGRVEGAKLDTGVHPM